MTEKVFADQAARDSIAGDIDMTMLVEAAAGTGKTYELSNRIMALVERGTPIEKIVAITFTKKAAGELADRVRLLLNEHIKKEKSSVKLEKFKTALFNFPNAYISTIHSFCERILREFPSEARLDPEFEVSSEGEDELILEKIWKEFWNERAGSGDRFIKEAMFFGVKFDDIKKAVFKRVDFRELFTPECVKQESLPDCSGLLGAIKEHVMLTEKNAPMCSNEDEGYMQCLEIQEGYEKYKADCKQYKGEELAKYKISSCVSFTQVNKGNQKNWDPKDALKELKAHGKEVKEKREAFREQLQDYFYSHLRDFQERFRKYFEDRKREHSIVDFTDLLIDARDLLKNSRDIRSRLSGRFEKILVDEFQDTDPIQAEILFYLAEDRGRQRTDSGRKWHELKLEEGKLFLVGDPKQSIYRFRRADISIYSKVKKSIGKCINLTANFRSQPVLLDYVNDIFGSRIIEDGAIQPGYIPLNPSGYIGDTGEKHIIGLDLDYAEGKKNAPEFGAEEAFALARLVRKLIDGKYKIRNPEVKNGGPIPLALEHIMILFLGRTERFYMLSSVFEAEGFYVEPDKEMMYKGAVIPQAVELLRALVRPDDTTAVVSVLRGIFFGLSDTVLLKMKVPGISFNLHSLVMNKEKMPPEAKGAVEALSGLLESKHKMSPAQFVMRVMDTAGAHVIAALGNSRSPDIRRLARLKNNLIDKIDSALSLESAIEEAVLEMDDYEVENSLIIEPGKIRMQTIHGAKGLEAPVVILADSMGYFMGGIDSIPMRDRNTVLLSTSVKTDNFGSMKFRPAEWTDEAEEAEKNYLQAEDERLRYVAVTRARDLLIVPINNKGSDRYFCNPMAEKILEYSADEDNKRKVEVIKASDLLGKKSGDEVDKMRIMDFHDKPFLPEADKLPSKPDPEIEKKWRAVKKEKDEKIKSLTDSSISVVSVVGQADGLRKSRKLPLLAEIIKRDSFGKEGGTFFHNVYENLLKYPEINVDKLMDYCIFASEILDSKKTDELKALSKDLIPVWRKAEIYRRLTKADDLIIETPFIFPDKDSNVVYNGNIDILFREGNNWSIIDLKSDPMDEGRIKEKEIQSALEPYKFQLKTYKKAAEKIMNTKISATLLYFLLDNFLYQFQ